MENLVDRLKTLDLRKFAGSWRTEALSRLLWLHGSVCLDVDGISIRGVLAGIDEHGGLMLATPEGIVNHMRGTLRKV